jgi:alpha-beta hydrolase superfamily lysophospholipase
MNKFFIFFLFAFNSLISQEIVISSFDNHKIYGSLLKYEKSKSNLAIIISGSGPTDRNGNNSSIKGNYLKILADELYKKGISSYRFDKRGVAKSIGDLTSDNQIKFQDFINDVDKIIKYFIQSNDYNSITVIGHSEGSLIGMIAGQKSELDKFISIAGAGEDYLTLIQRQLSNRAPYIKSMSDPIIAQLRVKKLVDSVPPILNNLFGPGIQRFLIDAGSYDPREEISKLNIPILITQGTNDIQIEVKDAQMLYDAAPSSTLEIIEGMNHVFRQASENFILNLQTYGNPDLPIDNSLVNIIVEFINKN